MHTPRSKQLYLRAGGIENESLAVLHPVDVWLFASGLLHIRGSIAVVVVVVVVVVGAVSAVVAVVAVGSNNSGSGSGSGRRRRSANLSFIWLSWHLPTKP